MRVARTFFLVLGLCIALVAGSIATAATIQLRASLNGAQEVPPNLATPATGTGVMTFDTVTRQLTWTINFSNLQSAISDAHFHGPTPAGVDAGIQVPIGPGVSPLIGAATLTVQQAAELLAGQYYINIHTANLPGGEIRGQVLPVRNDFNADGNSDILWRNTDGTNYVWQVNGASILGGVLAISSQGLLPGVDTSWAVAGVGDFNGDGKLDIFWRRNDGTNYIWHVDGATINGGVLAISSQGLLPTVDTSWTVVGIGDFNGDGKSDILWRKNDGTNYVWHVDGATINGGVLSIASQGLLPSVDTIWNVAGIGDFNGDGKADILWRDSEGTNYVWHVNGASISGGILAISTQGLLPGVDTSWGVVGVGDFNGEGLADILWRNTDGTNYVWQVNGNSISGGVLAIASQGLLPGVTDMGWSVVGVADYNGDGKADIFWRHTDGTNYVWHVDGATISGGVLAISSQGLLPGVGAGWVPFYGSLSPIGIMPALYVEAWSSADTSVGFDLGVVDPDLPATLITIDQLPAIPSPGSRVVRVRGGNYNSAEKTVSGFGTRHVIYIKNGSIYKLTLDKVAGVTPAPVRLSNETQAQANSLNVVAQSLSGDDALIFYLTGNPLGRYVRLSTAPTNAPIDTLTPTFGFPGDSVSPPIRQSWITDPATGAIAGYLFTNGLVAGGIRLSRTDAGFGNPVSIRTFSSFRPLVPWSWSSSYGKMRNGYFFVAEGALQRYDPVTGDIRIVHAGVSDQDFGSSTFDDDSIYFRMQTAGGPKLIKAADTADSTGVVLVDGPLNGNIDPFTHYQTHDYLIYHPDLASNAISVRKSDGFQTVLPAQPGLLFSWGGLFTLNFAGPAVGNRVFYQRVDLSVGLYNIFGSVNADGTDRKEFLGLPTTVHAEPTTIASHRVFAQDMDRPLERLLITTWPPSQYPPSAGPNTLAWVNASTGDIDVAVGTVPGAFFSSGNTFGSPHGPYTTSVITRAGVYGYSVAIPHTAARRLDAVYMSDQPNSVVRLTNYNP